MSNNQADPISATQRVGTEKGRATNSNEFIVGELTRATDRNGKPMSVPGHLGGVFHVTVEGRLNSPEINLDEFVGKPLSADGTLKVPQKIWDAIGKRSVDLFDSLTLNGVAPDMVVGFRDFTRLQADYTKAYSAMMLARSMGSSLKEGPDGRITGTFDGRFDKKDFEAPNELVLRAAAQILKDSGIAPNVKIAPEDTTAQNGCGGPKPDKVPNAAVPKCGGRQ